MADTRRQELRPHEVEYIVHAALGRQMRLTSLFGLLLLGLGFVLGHYVSAQHTQSLAVRFDSRFKEQTELVTESLTSISTEIAAEIAELRVQTDAVQVDHQRFEDRVRQQIERTQAQGSTHDDMRHMLLTSLIRQVEADKRGMLRELKPHLDRHTTLPASDVSAAVTRLMDSQLARLNHFIEADQRVSNRSTDPNCPVRSHELASAGTTHSLVPIPENQHLGNEPEPTPAPALASQPPVEERLVPASLAEILPTRSSKATIKSRPGSNFFVRPHLGRTVIISPRKSGADVTSATPSAPVQ